METLHWADYLTIGIYFVVVLMVGIWSTCRPNRGSTSGYFLAGKNMHWIPIGASIYASNIGAPIFVGLSGSAAASGISVTIYEWHAIFFLIALGWIFVPVYISCGAFTTPEYLRKRFGGKRLRIYASIIALIGYIIFNISIEIFTGAIFLQQVIGWNIYLSVAIILLVTAVFTTVGGLASVIYTDTLQTAILIVGATILAITSWIDVGGWNAMQYKYMEAAANYTLANKTFYACGMPREDSFHIFRDPITGDIPWPGALLGLSTLGLNVWCQDQLMAQRCLAGKNISHAKGGSVFGAILKLSSLILFIIPGMISRIMFPDEVACADPEKCRAVCGNPAGCTNLAYPLLVLRLLPVGLRGLMLAALMAALMSSLTSIMNSASTIVTMDVWRLIRKRPKETELMIVGRVTVVILVVSSILWLPIMEKVQGSQFWTYAQSIRSYITPPFCMLFLLGIFWKRATEQGMFWGLMLSLVVGIIRMVLDFTNTPPLCGSGEPDTRPDVISKVDFLYFATLLAIFSTIVMVVISLFTTPRPERKLHRVTWWTRNDKEEPDLDSEEEDEPTEQEPAKEHVMVLEQRGRWSRFKRYCYNYVMGKSDRPAPVLSKEEVMIIRKRMTSLDQKDLWRKVLNTTAIAAAIVTTFLLGYFA